MPYLLPVNYQFNHSYCFLMHDFLVKIVKYGCDKGFFNHSFKIKAEDKSQIVNKKGNDLYEWLITNGYENEWGMSAYKQVFVATLSDLLQFVFNALRASEKGHLTVTFALLRKPLKDNLLILEWLLDNPDEFITKFDSDASYNEIDIGKICKDKKLSIITNACSKLPFPMYDAESIYNFRYEKEADIGMESSWQKANHIITSRMPYRTESGNLNFIFSSETDKLSQWNYLYFLLPILLFHTLQVAYMIYNGTIDKDYLFDTDIFDRLMIIQLLSYRFVIPKLNSSTEYDISKFELKCPKCGAKIKLTPKIQETITRKWYFRCNRFHKNYLFAI